jgi:hypothetical protein
MHPNAEMLTRFYTAFAARDAATMAACYAADATFSDPVFTDLRGPQVGQMWTMLCERGKDLRIEFSGIEADDSTGKAHWEAWYSFSVTKRNVHNVIDASFTFEGGKIATHQDRFDLWRWTRMALGPTGVLLGWTPLVQNRVRSTAAKGLAEFTARKV